jgi:serine/threonine protein kinase/tetratricopeptide (TPR) repeat protein
MSVETIFATASQKPPTERADYLNEACGADADLRRKVERLLKAHDAAGEFLESPAERPVGTINYEPIAEQVGAKIGPYVLREQIGEGGFGLVFVAEQTEPVKRKVALKVIKPGMDTREVMARFEAERQALALMDHPNIAKVLDAGSTDSGRPYFVMELVRGIPVTEYCDKNQLAPKERLELFVTVCQAIQHAHQKGIIHRDVKPSNVLVTSHDGKPVAKVIDFGVAKAINQQLSERSIYTNFAQMIGTPLYMSPEQAEMSGLDIDTRSDIYSLGVLLYELLTGTTPLEKKKFAQAAYDEIRRLIREEEPPKPSTRLSTSDAIASIAAQRHMEPAKLSKLMRGDLDWITMKCLEKDRTRRYETANGLARDIQRYLSDEPVEACPPSATYRLRKFAKKNRAALATAAAIILLLVAGIAGTTFGMIRATRAERAALAAKEAEAEQRGVAEANEQKARAAAAAETKSNKEAQEREAETKAVLNFVENKVFAAARPKGHDGGQGYDVKLADAVKAALPFVKKSFTTQPLIEARLRITMGNSFLCLGDQKTAAEQFQAARQIFTERLGPDHPYTLGSMNNLAMCYAESGRMQEAIPLYEETLKLQKFKLGPDHPDTLASINNLATCYDEVGRTQEALKLHEESLRIMKTKFGPDNIETLASMVNLSVVYRIVGRHADAIKLLEEALPIMKAKLPDHPFTFNCMESLALCYDEVGRIPEALQLNEETLLLRKAKLGPERTETLGSMINLAGSYGNAGRVKPAIKLCEEALPILKAKSPRHPFTFNCMCNLAGYYDSVGRHAEALKLYEDSLALRKAVQGPKHPETLGNIWVLAWFLVSYPDEKLADPQRAVELATQAVDATPKNAILRTVLGAARFRAGDWKGAIADLEQAINLNAANPADSTPAFFLAMAYWQAGDKATARKWFDKSVAWMDQGNQKDDAKLKRFRAEAAALLGIKDEQHRDE